MPTCPHLPDASVQVITFARETKARHARFVRAKVAIKDLAAAKLDRHNGSFVDDALTLADASLAKEKKRRRRSGRAVGEARILLFTDTMTRRELGTAELSAIANPNAVLHVVQTSSETLNTLTRTDAHAWAPVTRKTGGVVWQAGVDKVASKSVIEELIRPMRIHNFSVNVRNMSTAACGPPSTLDEGASFTCNGLDKNTARWAAVAGELWTQPIRVRKKKPDKVESDRWAALLFGHHDHTALSEKEMMAVAMRGKAVSPVTSYLAIEPGVRPSTIGIDWGMGGLGLIGVGESGGGIGEGIGLGTMQSFDHRAHLQKVFGAAWKSCGGKTGHRARVDRNQRQRDRRRLRGHRQGARKATCVSRKEGMGRGAPEGLRRRRRRLGTSRSSCPSVVSP